MTDKIEDSLDNLPNRQKSVSPKQKQDKQKALLYNLKQKYTAAIAKLQNSETRQLALKQIHNIMDKNRQSQYIRMYISVLKSLKIQGTSSSTKQHQILVFSIMAEIFKTNLLDPIDKPTPSVMKTVFRLLQMLHLYFSDSTNTVQQACARVLIDFGKYVLQAQSNANNIEVPTIISLIFSPLVSILKTGVDKASQSTASVCINELIFYWKGNIRNPKYNQMLNIICGDLLNASLRLNCQYHELFSALYQLIDLKGLQFFKDKIIQFVNKILGVINKMPNKNSEQSNNFNSYMSKVNVCRILQKIGILIQQNDTLKAKLDELDVQPSLQKANRNRVIQVQTAAHRALKAWKGQPIPEFISQKRPSSQMSGRPGLMSLEKARNNRKKQRSTSREERMKLQSELNYMQEDLNKLVKGGWGPHKRANNYVKKNTGVGGGYCGKMDSSPSSKPVKSHKQHIQQLRQFIKKGAQEHGKQDKYSFYPEKNEEGQKPEIVQYKNKEKVVYSKKPKQKRQDDEFELQQDGGDQGVNLGGYRNPYAQQNVKNDRSKIRNVDSKTKYKEQSKVKNIEKVEEGEEELYNRIRSQNLDDYMDEKEMKQLLQGQNEIMDWQNKNNNDLIFGSLLSDVEKQVQQVRQLKESHLQKSQKKSKTEKVIKTKEQIVRKQTKKSIERSVASKQNSKETLGLRQLSIDYENVSQVSSNFDGLLSESQMRAINMNINNQTNNNHRKPSENSLRYTQEREEQQRKYHMPVKSHFTLNPHQTPEQSLKKHPSDPSKLSKFNSFKYERNEEEEIDEKLDESVYEQSYPQSKKVFTRTPVLPQRDQQDMRHLFRKTVEHGYELDRKAANSDKKDEEKSHVYQEMIKNPPRSHLGHHLDKPSHLGTQGKAKQPQKKEQYEQEQDENITDTWQRVLTCVQENEINEAYSLVFEMEDPIYLLRLMLMTQIPLKKLTPSNSCLLWQKFLEIYNHRFIDNIFVQMFSHVNDLSGGRGLKNRLSIEETNELMIELYELSGRTKGKLSYSSANLYNSIDETIHGRRQ